MKTPKSARPAKPSAKKSRSTTRPLEPHVPLADVLRNIIEIVKAEGDDPSLIALMLPSAALASLSKEKKGNQLPTKDRLWLQILDLLYDYDLMPQSVLEAVHLILTHGAVIDEETGEMMLGFLNKAFYPGAEMKKVLAPRDEEEKTERKRMKAAQRKAERAVALARIRRSRVRGRVIKSENRK